MLCLKMDNAAYKFVKKVLKVSLLDHYGSEAS